MKSSSSVRFDSHLYPRDGVLTLTDRSTAVKKGLTSGGVGEGVIQYFHRDRKILIQLRTEFAETKKNKTVKILTYT